MIPQIAPTQFDAWLSAARAHGEPLLLDVREPWEVQTASVRADGFELVCIPMGTLPARLQDLDPNRPVACLCHHGARSQRVAMFLAGNGFAHVANVAGGIDAWSRSKDPAVPLY